MRSKKLFHQSPRFVYKNTSGQAYGGSGVKDTTEVPEGDVEDTDKLTVDALLELRKDKEGLAAFVKDFSEIEEEKREKERGALQESAVKRLKLAELVDDKKMDDEAKRQLEENAQAYGTDFTDKLFELVNDGGMDVEDKIKGIDDLLGEFQVKVEAKAKEKEQHKGVLDSFNRGKAFILGSIIALPVFKLLPELWQKKVAAMEGDPDLSADDVAKQTAEIIKKETGEDIDLTDLMIAHAFSGAKDVAQETAEGAAEEGGDIAAKGIRGAVAEGETSMIDWVRNSIGMIQGNVYAHSFGAMAKACGVSKSALFACAWGQDARLQTVGELAQKVEGVTYDGLLEVNEGDVKKTDKAWKNVEEWRKIVDWLHRNTDNIKGLINQAIERLPNLSREDQEHLKSEFEPENMRVAQVAFAMFGDHDLEREWLMKAPVYISRSLHFYKVTKHGLSGALLDYLKPSNGHRAAVAVESEKYASKARKIELDLTSDLGVKGLGDQAKAGTFDVIEDLKKNIQEYDFKGGDLDATAFTERNRRVDAFQKTVGTVEERFKVIANELGKQGESLRRVEKSAGSLAGKTLADLRIDVETKQLMRKWLGGGFDPAMSLEVAFGKIKTNTAEKITNLASLQRNLNQEIIAARDMLKSRVLNPFEDAVKLQLRGKTATKELIDEVRKTSGTLVGETKYWGPKLAMPVFGIGVSLWQGVKQKQGIKKTALMVTEAGLSFVPYIGGIMDVSLGIDGYDLAGNKLSTLERTTYVGFGALTFVADLFGGYALRAGLATVIKGRRGIKAVSAIGKEESLIVRGGKYFSELGHLFSKPRQLEHTKGALKATREAAEVLRSKVAGGTASWMEKLKLSRMDAKAVSLETKEARLTSQVTTDAVLKEGGKALREGAIKAHGTKGKMYSKVLHGLGVMSVPAMLAWVISQGNVTPMDLGEYGVKGVKMAGEGAAWGMGQFFKGGEKRTRAVDEMLAQYQQEKQLESALEEKIEESGDNAMEFMGENMHLPQVATVAARMGISGSEFAKSDSGYKLAESIAS